MYGLLKKHRTQDMECLRSTWDRALGKHHLNTLIPKTHSNPLEHNVCSTHLQRRHHHLVPGLCTPRLHAWGTCPCSYHWYMTIDCIQTCSLIPVLSFVAGTLHTQYDIIVLIVGDDVVLPYWMYGLLMTSYTSLIFSFFLSFFIYLFFLN